MAVRTEKNVPMPPINPNGVIHIKIDKRVPIPPITRRRGVERFPWDNMEPGDSFFVSPSFDPDNPSLEVFHKRMASRAISAGKKHEARYIARCVRQGQVEGVRVWRLPPEE